MSEAIAWLEEAKERLQEMDYLGITPDPQPILSDEDMQSVLQGFWVEGWSIGQTYAWSIAAEQSINPFEIKRQFDYWNYQYMRSQNNE